MHKDLFNYIERLANLLRQEARHAGQDMGLQPVQLEALSYLSTCNQYSDTLLAVTEYLGLTKGTVSQSLKVLENKGLIEKVKDAADKRVTHLVVTDKGRKLLWKTSPPTHFSQAVDVMPTNQQAALKVLLKDMLAEYQQQSGRKGFGVCKTCKFNESGEQGFRCGLTKDTLTERDISLICREHELPN